MTPQMRISAVALLLAGLPGAFCDWQNLRTGGTGPGTVYGYGQNSKGSCSYGTNSADTAGLPWSTAPGDASDGGTGLDVTYIALNQEDLNGGAACGSCLWFRGTGPGIGVETKKISTKWQYGVVDNVCPECKKGALDLARSYKVGDGIWTVEWHAVPCKVGDTKLYFSFPLSSPYYFNMVVSNGRVPVKNVVAEIEGKDVALTRTSNNQWAYHNSDGFYEFPLKLKITPTCGETVTDVVDSLDGGFGKSQFGRGGCPSEGNPVTGANTDPNAIGGFGTGSLSTESDSAQRALTKPAPAANTTPKKVSRKQSMSKSRQQSKSKPTNKPTNKPTIKPTNKPTIKPTRSLSPKSSKKDTGAPVASAKPAPAGTPQELYGGVYSKTLKRAVLPPWYQCGNYNGPFENIVCGKKGFSCVEVTPFYMQCRNDDGSKANTPNKPRRLLHSADN